MAWTTPRTWTDGELVNAAIMNPHIRDNFSVMGLHLIVRKTADESVTSSTAMQNDNELLMTVGASEVWQYQAVLLAEGTAGDLGIGFSFPTAGRVTWSAAATNSAGTAAIQAGSTTTTPTGQQIDAGLFTSPAYIPVVVNGVFVNSTTAGSFQVMWAQMSSSGTPTTVKANSTLWAVQLA